MGRTESCEWIDKQKQSFDGYLRQLTWLMVGAGNKSELCVVVRFQHWQMWNEKFGACNVSLSVGRSVGRSINRPAHESTGELIVVGFLLWDSSQFRPALCLQQRKNNNRKPDSSDGNHGDNTYCCAERLDRLFVCHSFLVFCHAKTEQNSIVRNNSLLCC